jgi:hypothetical protein
MIVVVEVGEEERAHGERSSCKQIRLALENIYSPLYHCWKSKPTGPTEPRLERRVSDRERLDSGTLRGSSGLHPDQQRESSLSKAHGRGGQHHAASSYDPHLHPTRVQIPSLGSQLRGPGVDLRDLSLAS